MSPELVEKLFTTYPGMFSRLPRDQIQCEDGWYTLIATLCEQIQWHSNHEPACEPVYVRQIKEKFGGLRFYRSGGDDWVGGLISMAEGISKHTCEICGDAGTLAEGGPIQTRCPAHA